MPISFPPNAPLTSLLLLAPCLLALAAADQVAPAPAPSPSDPTKCVRSAILSDSIIFNSILLTHSIFKSSIVSSSKVCGGLLCGLRSVYKYRNGIIKHTLLRWMI